MPLKLPRCLIISLSVFFLLLLNGCGTLGSKSSSTIYDRKGVDVFVEPSTGISYLLTDEGTHDQFCMAPPPDLSDVKGSSDSLSVKGVAVTNDTALSVATLGGRSPAVLISREIMYRTCELYVNLKMTKQETILLFRDSLDRVMDVTKAQIARGTQTQISTNTGTTPSSTNDDGPSASGGFGSPPTSGANDSQSSGGSAPPQPANK